jgi:FAD/FMN-containing dehydrogenase
LASAAFLAGAAGVELLRAIKRNVDPGDRFNPGKMIP